MRLGFGAIVRYDRTTGAVVQVDVSTTGVPSGASREPAISRDGRYVAFRTRTTLAPEDGNGQGDIYLSTISLPKRHYACSVSASGGDPDDLSSSGSIDQ